MSKNIKMVKQMYWFVQITVCVWCLSSKSLTTVKWLIIINANCKSMQLKYILYDSLYQHILLFICVIVHVCYKKKNERYFSHGKIRCTVILLSRKSISKPNKTNEIIKSASFCETNFYVIVLYSTKTLNFRSSYYLI